MQINYLHQKKTEYISKRKYTEESIANFNGELSGIDWAPVYCADGVENKFNTFINIISSLHNKYFPLIETKINIRSLFKPWLTSSILNSIKKKNNLYRNYIKTKSPTLKANYIKYKNKLVSIIRLAEKQYYVSKLMEVKDNISKTWKIMNQMCGRNSTHKRINEIVVNDVTIDDPLQMANTFNKYFVNVGPSLANNIPMVNKQPSNFLHGNFTSSMYLLPTNQYEVSDIITNLKNTNSKGFDELPVNLIKRCNTGISPILAYLNNQSFLEGIFPDHLKIAKVIPVYKCDDSKCISNYRPISVLTAFSKISEKLVCARLNKYLMNNSFLHDSQYGFREQLSTSMALLKLTDDISKSIDEGNLTVGVFIDLAKAFDTVDHNILLNKLNHYGIRGVVNDWFRSYLTNRMQYVSIDKSNSTHSLIKCGVPQGSILGPVLFLIYINDLNQVSDILHTIMFADDTNLFLSGSKISEIERKLNNELSLLTEWFSANRLSLNIKKTSYIVFCNRKNIDANILLANTRIGKVNDTKFLGVIISSNLSWNKHIDVIINKMSKTIGIIAKVRHLLLGSARTLYMTLVEPYINYCNIVWAQPDSTCHLNKILKIQKKYCRIITFSDFRAHSEPLFKQLNILTVYKIYKYQLSLFMYKQSYKLLPPSHTYSFITNSSIHDHYTRQCNQIHIGHCRTSKRQMTVLFQGPKLWNSLPITIKSCPSINVFRRRIKALLLSA